MYNNVFDLWYFILFVADNCINNSSFNPNTGLMLVHSLRRWPNIKPILGKWENNVRHRRVIQYVSGTTCTSID